MKYFSLLMTLALAFSALSAAAADQHEEKVIVMKKHKGFMLGVMLTTPDKEVLEKNAVKGGALIMKVIDDSEAERIGLKKGDLIVKFDGKAIGEPEDVSELVEKIEQATEVAITIKRDGREMSFTAKLKPSEDEGEQTFNFEFDDDMPLHWVGQGPHKMRMKFFDEEDAGMASKGGFLGVGAKNLNKELLEYFEVEHGVLVEEVVENSPAQKAGFKAGDVITAINDRPVKDYSDLVRTLNYYNPGEKVTVKYSRKGSRKSATVELGEKKAPKIIKKKIMMPARPALEWHKSGDHSVEIIKDIDEEGPEHDEMFMEKDVDILII